MNMRLMMKLVLILAVLLFMVMMGMSNRDTVQFSLKPLGFISQQTSAIMYFIFFGAGVVVGGLLAVGGSSGKGQSKSKSN